MYSRGKKKFIYGKSPLKTEVGLKNVSPVEAKGDDEEVKSDDPHRNMTKLVHSRSESFRPKQNPAMGNHTRIGPLPLKY